MDEDGRLRTTEAYLSLYVRLWSSPSRPHLVVLLPAKFRVAAEFVKLSLLRHSSYDVHPYVKDDLFLPFRWEDSVDMGPPVLAV